MVLASLDSASSSQPDGKGKAKISFLARLIAAVEGALTTHALRIQHLLPIVSTLLSRLRVRVVQTGKHFEVDQSGRGKTAAELLLMGLLKDIADLRTQRGFEHQQAVDEVVGMAIQVIGVRGVLDELPLNLEPDA